MATSSDGIEIPCQVKAVMERHQLSTSLLERMSVANWQEFEQRCGDDIPFGLLLQVRFAIADKVLQAEEEMAKIDTRRQKALLEKMKSTVGKLFHGNEGIGTLIYVATAVGLCAFHSVHTKENHTILEKSLSVDGFAVEFKAGYPSLDLALYRIIDAEGRERQGPFIELELDSYMFEGSPISLVSFPAFDSQSRDVEDEDPMFVNGNVSRLQLDKNSAFAVGHYSSFPNCSGGAVISKRGKLLGMHVEGVYHEDRGHYKRPCSPPLPEGPIYPPLPTDGQAIPALILADNEDEEEDKSLDDEKEESLLQYAVDNVQHKDSLASIIPVYHLREILKREKIIVSTKHSHSKKGKRARH